MIKTNSTYGYFNSSYTELGLLFAFYLGVFLLLFMQFPLHGSLMGNDDTWANLAMIENAASFLSGNHIGVSNYPMQDVWSAFGLDFLSSSIYLFFKSVGVSELWAYYLYMCILFASNSLGIYLVVSCFSHSRLVALLTGLLFSTNNFVFSQMDNPNTLAMFFGLVSIYGLLRFLHFGKHRTLLLASALAALQVYMAPYIFVFTIAIIVIILLFNFSNVFSKLNLATAFAAVLIPITLLIPFFIIQFGGSMAQGKNMIDEAGVINMLSLNLDDFLYTLPNNILNNPNTQFESWHWFSILKSGFIGILLPLLAVVGFLKAGKHRWMLFIMVLVGLLLAFGPYISIRSQVQFKAPMYWLYESLGFKNLVRIPIRALLMSLIALCILASIGLTYLLDKLGTARQLLVVGLIVLGYGAFQIPWPFYKYNSVEYLQYHETYFETLAEFSELQGVDVVVNLPSALFSEDGREYLYMLWQNKHQLNIINGSVGYFPQYRLDTDSLLREIETPEYIEALLASTDVQLLVFHKDLVNSEKEDNQLTALKQAAQLNFIKEDEHFAWFLVIPN